MTSRPRAQNTIFTLAVTLMVIQVAYGVYWAGHDLSARLGLWPNEQLAEEFLNSLTFSQEAFFFSHVILNFVVLGLLLRRSRYTLPLFILSFILDRIEWVLMTDNTLFNQVFDGTILTISSFTLQALIIVLLTVLTFEISPTSRRA